MLFMITPDLSKINEFWKKRAYSSRKFLSKLLCQKISVRQQKPDKMASTIAKLNAEAPDRKSQRKYSSIWVESGNILYIVTSYTIG